MLRGKDAKVPTFRPEKFAAPPTPATWYHTPADGRALPALEHALWCALDAALRPRGALDPRDARVLPRLLALLPPEPPEPWPRGFVLDALAAALAREGDDEVVSAPREYCARRRAHRLSFAVWSLIGLLAEDPSPEDTRQSVLEMTSTAERLQTAISRIGEIAKPQ